jgi:hypothetical protein
MVIFGANDRPCVSHPPSGKLLRYVPIGSALDAGAVSSYVFTKW